MSPLKKRVMSSREEHTLAGCEVELQGRADVSCRAPQACTGRPGVPGGPWPGSTLAQKASRPRQQAVFQCSPQNLAFLPIHSRCRPHTLLILVTSPQPGIQARSLPHLPSRAHRAQSYYVVWKLKTVTERQAGAVMLRHSSTDVVL